MTYIALPPNNTYGEVITIPAKATGSDFWHANNKQGGNFTDDKQAGTIQVDSIKIENNVIAKSKIDEKKKVLNFLTFVNSMFVILGVFFLVQAILSLWGKNIFNGLYATFISVGFFGLFRVFFRAWQIIKSKTDVVVA